MSTSAPTQQFSREQTTFVASTGSTNADLLARAREGDWSTRVLVAEHQTAGRGRLDRRWEQEPGSSLLVSFLVRPPASSDSPAHPLLPLAVGLSALGAVRAHGGASAGLKWPNDVLVGEKKLGGILVEAFHDGPDSKGAVAGLGLNLTSAPEGAVSVGDLTEEPVDRDTVLADVARLLDRWVWMLGGESPGSGETMLLDAYRTACITIGRPVRVDTLDGGHFEGYATGIDRTGRLAVDVNGEERLVHAGDVHHVRPGSVG